MIDSKSELDNHTSKTTSSELHPQSRNSPASITAANEAYGCNPKTKNTWNGTSYEAAAQEKGSIICRYNPEKEVTAVRPIHGTQENGIEIGVGEDGDPPLSITKRRRGPKVAKRRRKRLRFTAPLPSDEDTDDAGMSSNTLKRQEVVVNDQSTSRPPRSTVVYQEQRWEGEIVNEKDLKQGRGRPRKQYLIQWKQSWVDSNRLNEPLLLHNWRKKKQDERHSL